MAIHTSAGSKIYIGGVSTGSENLAAYLAKTWVEIGEVESISPFGMTYNEITFTSLSDRLVRKFKGSKNPGTITITAGHDIDNAGQDAIRVAVGSDSDYCFRIALNDYDGGSPLQDTNIFFNGKAMSDTTEVNNVDSITMTTFSVGINTEFVIQEAA
jgi:hypothetical protein